MADTYTFSPATGRYRGADGKFVPDALVRSSVDQTLDAGTARVRVLSERLQAGSIDLATWQTGMASEVRTLNLLAATAGHGGWNQMAPSDFGWVGSQVKKELGYLNNFAAEIANGKQALDGRLLTRVTLYTEKARATFAAMQARDARVRDVNEEKNVLAPSDHCAGCLSADGQGWVPLGTLTPPGSRTCLARCRCRLTYRRAA